MSPRRARRREDEARPLNTEAIPRTEAHPDGDWHVRFITGSSSTKTYRCPGCDQEIRPATPHIVAWRFGEEDHRRHWHRPCWMARDRRGPVRG